MTQRLSIACEIPLPPDLIDSRKIEGPFLELAEKFRADAMKLADKMKVAGVTFGTRVVKTKEGGKKKTATDLAGSIVLPAAEPITVVGPAGGKPSWATSGSPLAAQLAAAEGVDE